MSDIFNLEHLDVTTAKGLDLDVIGSLYMVIRNPNQSDDDYRKQIIETFNSIFCK